MSTAIMIMAAGESSRFGSCKQLSELDSQHSLLSHAVEEALKSEVGPVFVITGRWHQEIEQAQHRGQLASVPLLCCSQWAQGLGNSIAYGTRMLEAEHEAILITLADQVALQASDFRQLAAQAHPQLIIAARYNGKPGVPALFPAACFADLMLLHGEHGARHLLRGGVLAVEEIPLANAACDIDTPQALAQWQQQTRILT